MSSLAKPSSEQQTHPAALVIDSGKVAGGMEAKHDWAEELTTAETIFRRHGTGPGFEPKRPILIPRVRRCEALWLFVAPCQLYQYCECLYYSVGIGLSGRPGDWMSRSQLR